MNEIEVKLMRSMVNVLNDAKDSYYIRNSPILTKEQYDMRMQDLKEFENETGFILAGSPTLQTKTDISVEIKNVPIYNYKECYDIMNVINFGWEKELLIYPNLIGTDMVITYSDGIMTKIQTNKDDFYTTRINNIPYKINKQGECIVFGKILSDNGNFFVYDIIADDFNDFKSDKVLDEAKKIGFDVIPHWTETISYLNYKNIDANVNYVIDYVKYYAEQENLSCDGVVFTFNTRDDFDMIIYKDN